MLEQRLEILHGNAAAVLFYVRSTLSVVSIKKFCHLLERGKRTSETECGESKKVPGKV